MLLVVAVGGWRAYEWWEAKKAAEAGTAFQAAVALAGEGKNKEAEEAFAKLAADRHRELSHAGQIPRGRRVARRDPKAAVAIYDQLAADGSFGRVLQDLAALRAGTILVDTAPYSEIAAAAGAADRAGPHVPPQRPQPCSRSSAWRAKDMTAMRKWSDMILADAETPSGTRGQIQMLLALVGRRPEELKRRCAIAASLADRLAARVRADASGCSTFDPTEWFNTQEAAARRSQGGVSAKACRAWRRACRPNWCRAIQPPAEPVPEPKVVEEKPKPKPKPKPKAGAEAGPARRVQRRCATSAAPGRAAQQAHCRRQRRSAGAQPAPAQSQSVFPDPPPPAR